MLLGKEEFGTVSKFLMFYTTYICYRYYMVSRKQLKVTGVPSMLYTSIYITPGPTYKKGLFCVITELAQTLVFRQWINQRVEKREQIRVHNRQLGYDTKSRISHSFSKDVRSDKDSLAIGHARAGKLSRKMRKEERQLLGGGGIAVPEQKEAL